MKNNKSDFFDIYKKNISINKLKSDINNLVKNFNNNSINKLEYITYPEFLRYFNDIHEITKHNLIIGISYTYSWMPTIFNFKTDKFDEVLKILNEAKKDKLPDHNSLNILKECFNNSMVGTTKLLHFINPHKFAIWDSRVYRYLTCQQPHPNRLDNTFAYLDYLKFCDFVTSHQDFNQIHDTINNIVGYEMTKYRTLELFMYLNDQST